MRSAHLLQFAMASLLFAVMSLSHADEVEPAEKAAVKDAVAPFVGLADLDGKPQKFKDFLAKDKWTVVMLWASDCHVCNKEAHEYVAFQEKHKNGNIQMLGLTLDGKANLKEAREFVAEHKLNFPNLIGEPETIAGLYYDLTGDFFYGTPSIIVFDTKGETRGGQAGAIPPSIIEEFIQGETVASAR